MKVKLTKNIEKTKEINEIMYNLSKLVSLPTIKVLLLKDNDKKLGLAYLQINTIVINEKLDGIKLYSTVLHEVLHLLGIDHDENCILMSSKWNKDGYNFTTEQYKQAFLKHLKAV